MANYKKSFNFRNGVQVDDSNFIVNANGLVGIGTSLPTEFLDVRGNIVSSGVVTTKNVYATGVSTFKDNVLFGSGVTVFSSLGIVSATSFRGDGSLLDNISGSKWRVDPVAGLTTTSDVGIGTTDPSYRFQVGQDPTPPSGIGTGVGIDSTGQAYFTGIVTSNGGYATVGFVTAGNLTITGVSTFEGDINANGNIVGDNSTNISGIASVTSSYFYGDGSGITNLSGIDTTGLSDFTNINVSGVSTFAGNIDANGNLDVDGTTDLDVLNVAELATFTGNIDANGTLDVDGDTQLDDLTVAGVATFSSAIDGNGGANIAGTTTLDQLNTSGDLTVGVSTLFVDISTGRIGVGSAIPQADLDVAGGRILVDAFRSSFDSDYNVDRGIFFRQDYVGVSTYNLSIITYDHENSGADQHKDGLSINATDGISFCTGSNTRNEKMRITSSGNVGIGTTIPTGAAALTGNTQVLAVGVVTATSVYGTLQTAAQTNVTSLGTLSAVTVSGAIDANGTLDVDGDTQLDDLNVAGVATFSSVIDANDYVNINTNLYVAGISTFDNTLYARELLEAKVGSGISAYGELKVASFNSGTSGLSSHYGALRYGNESGSFGYSTRRSLDILNYDTGNINFNLDASNINANVGSFYWSKYNNPIMTLTNTGNLGIGITLPEYKLHVSGVSSFTSDVTCANNVTVGGNLTLSAGSFTGDVTGNLTGNLTGAINASDAVGMNTISLLESDDGIGIGVTSGGKRLRINNLKTTQVYVSTSGQVGICTDYTFTNVKLAVPDSASIFSAIGVGTVTLRSAADFGDAGATSNDSAANITKRFMIAPKVDNTQRTGLSTIAGGMIYNTDLNAHQSYNGSTWISIGSTVSGSVNVADYGADASKTDGTNVTAINNAISALGTNGGTVYFPGGEFYLNAAITLGASNNSIRFVGTGQQNYGGGSDSGGTVLRRDADDEFFNITNSRAIHFIGITFKGGAAGSDGGDDGISGGNGAIYVEANAGCQGYLIENCVFYGIVNCITFKGLSDSIIRGCRFRNVPTDKGVGQLIKLDENGSEPIDQIRIQDCVGDGYKGTGSAVLNGVVDGIAIYNTVNTIFVTNTSMIRLKRAFSTDSTWDGDFIYFQNCEAERSTGDGFSLNGTGNFITLDNCFACTCGTVNGVDGATGDLVANGINILTDQNSSVNITNPNVRDNTGHGILFDGTNNNYSVVNPAIGGNSKNSSGTYHGIKVGTTASNVYIAGGKIGGTTAELAGTGPQDYGILVDGTTHSNIRIIGTNVTGNQEADGISMSISSGTGNKVSLNSGSSVSFNT